MLFAAPGPLDVLDADAAPAAAESQVVGPDSTAFIKNTIPDVQCTGGPGCPQYPQVVAVAAVIRSDPPLPVS